MGKPQMPAYVYEDRSKSKIPPLSVERRRKKRIKFLAYLLVVLLAGAGGILAGLAIADVPVPTTI